MTPFRVLTPADFRPMPWKNGGGRTAEIAVRPEDAPPGGFDWRVSVADVERDGPFSDFPGVDRVLLLLSGRGMRLRGPGGDLDVREPFAPAAFPGEGAGLCTLHDGPVRDFNVMTRRDRVRASVTVVRGNPVPLPVAGATVCYAARGSWTFRAPAATAPAPRAAS